MAGFISEWWPTSNRNPGRLQIGIGGRIASEFARRNRARGGCYFFTVNLLDRRSDLLIAEIGALPDAVREARRTRPFHIDAWAVLPDHLHCLWTLPPGDADFPNRWRTIKALFSRRVAHPQDRRPSLVRKREAGVWQLRYWEHTTRDDADYVAHMDYIHFNPGRHGVAEHPFAWPFSSFLRCVTQGVYPEGWALADIRLAEYGERPEGTWRAEAHPTRCLIYSHFRRRHRWANRFYFQWIL